ncbi:hypothetical protein [Aquabacterium sp.]|uniref:hypothetical protein n=1 Tax=Aquabacterium sp. TaxID=1872578 RepID=UPI0025C2D58F|nr:hypothetical protein [Aquabacterium sp.]
MSIVTVITYDQASKAVKHLTVYEVMNVASAKELVQLINNHVEAPNTNTIIEAKRLESGDVLDFT